MKNGIVFCMIMLMATTAWSAILPADPDNFHTVQAEASTGDTIVMEPGVYHATSYPGGAAWATIVPGGRNIIYTSEDPDDPDCVANTVISGRGLTDDPFPELTTYSGGCCYFANGEDSSCQLIGLTIMRGYLESEGEYTGVIYDGSAVICIGSSPTISKCRIIGGDYGEDVGGIYCEDSNSVIEKCEILSAESITGYAPINVTTDTGQSSVTIRDCTIAGNIDYSAGGIVCRGSASVLVTHCRIFDNNGLYAGGIDFSGSTGTIRNCEIVGNQSTAGGGGGISVYSGSVAIENCTIVENVAGGYLGYGGGIFLEQYVGVSVDLANTILWGNIACNEDNEGEQIYNWSATVDINHCDIQNSYTSGGDVWGTLPEPDEFLGTDAGGNINADPEFVAEGSWSGNCPDPDEWTAGDYHLTTDSTACIDAGDDSVVDWDYDIDGEDRIVGLHVDIGADEETGWARITGGRSYATIQDAIDAAVDGNEIVVYLGVYNEHIDFGSKAITVSGSAPDDWRIVEATVIDGGGTGQVVRFSAQAISVAALEGLTVRNGGTGVYCRYGGRSVSNCIVEDTGTGIDVYQGDMDVNNCIVRGNTVGAHAEQATMDVLNSIISENTNGISYYYGSSTVRNNTIVGNSGYGITATYANPTVTNCIFWDNGTNLNGCSASYSWLSGDPKLFDDEPTSWWKLDDGEGTTAVDSGSSSDDGTLTGDADWADGKFGSAITLDGAGDYVAVSSLNGAYDSEDTFTVAGWFTTSQTTGKQTIVGQWAQYNPQGYPPNLYWGWQVLVENGKVVARFSGGGTTVSDITGTTDVNDPNWHHFALVYPTSSSNAVLYVDGESEGTPATRSISPNNTRFRIGDGSYEPPNGESCNKKGGPFNGIIDDVMIFERSLSSMQVQRLYSDGLIGLKHHLESDSDCIDAGNTALVETGEVDIDGEDRVMGDDVDMGADEYDPGS